MLVVLCFAFLRLPGGFLPVDDQGFITTDVQAPPEASFPRTLEAVKSVEDYLAKRPGVDRITFLTGFSFLGQGQNTAQAFITLKDWSERGAAHFAERIVADINSTFATFRDGKILALQPPPIDNLGNSSGFSFRLQDRGQRGYTELMRAKISCLRPPLAPSSPGSMSKDCNPHHKSSLRSTGRAAALGVTFEEIDNTISTNLGSAYINDFPSRGRMQRVIVRADRIARCSRRKFWATPSVMRAISLYRSLFATVQWSVGPTQIVGLNYYPCCTSPIDQTRPHQRCAIVEMERLAEQLPRGFGHRLVRTVPSRKLAGSQAPLLLALSVLLVFLVLAALYESWTIPLSVLLTVPLGIFAQSGRGNARGLPNHVYFTVELVTIIGLAAKDGILIIEFARR